MGLPFSKSQESVDFYLDWSQVLKEVGPILSLLCVVSFLAHENNAVFGLFRFHHCIPQVRRRTRDEPAGLGQIFYKISIL